MENLKTIYQKAFKQEEKRRETEATEEIVINDMGRKRSDFDMADFERYGTCYLQFWLNSPKNRELKGKLEKADYQVRKATKGGGFVFTLGVENGNKGKLDSEKVGYKAVMDYLNDSGYDIYMISRLS